MAKQALEIHIKEISSRSSKINIMKRICRKYSLIWNSKSPIELKTNLQQIIWKYVYKVPQRRDTKIEGNLIFFTLFTCYHPIDGLKVKKVSLKRQSLMIFNEIVLL